LRRIALTALLVVVFVVVLNSVSRTMPNPDEARAAAGLPAVVVRSWQPDTGGH
jgi:hypothetical protein